MSSRGQGRENSYLVAMDPDFGRRVVISHAFLDGITCGCRGEG